MHGCRAMHSSDSPRERVILSRKVRIFFAACAVALNLSCRTVLIEPPPCPVPSGGVVVDLSEIILLGKYEFVVRWIAEMDRYCDAVDAMSN